MMKAAAMPAAAAARGSLRGSLWQNALHIMYTVKLSAAAANIIAAAQRHTLCEGKTADICRQIAPAARFEAAPTQKGTFARYALRRFLFFMFPMSLSSACTVYISVLHTVDHQCFLLFCTYYTPFHPPPQDVKSHFEG